MLRNTTTAGSREQGSAPTHSVDGGVFLDKQGNRQFLNTAYLHDVR